MRFCVLLSLLPADSLGSKRLLRLLQLDAQLVALLGKRLLERLRARLLVFNADHSCLERVKQWLNFVPDTLLYHGYFPIHYLYSLGHDLDLRQTAHHATQVHLLFESSDFGVEMIASQLKPKVGLNEIHNLVQGLFVGKLALLKVVSDAVQVLAYLHARIRRP